MPHDRSPRTWMVTSDAQTFDAEAAFDELMEVDWTETSNAHLVVGDPVFLYATAPRSRLTHELVVTRTGGTRNDTFEGQAYWRDSDKYEARQSRTLMRLRLVRKLNEAQRAELDLYHLRKEGLRSAPQGRQVLGGELLRYIESVAHRAPRVETDMSDAAAEACREQDHDLIHVFEEKIATGDFAVEDDSATTKIRGNAQRAFAKAVKSNYDYACAVTGISTPAFLVASHIVPWAEDASIRLDPSNGICLSTLVDRAFDVGYLRISPTAVVEIAHDRLTDDPALRSALADLDGVKLKQPRTAAPARGHLERRYHSP